MALESFKDLFRGLGTSNKFVEIEQRREPSASLEEMPKNAEMIEAIESEDNQDMYSEHVANDTNVNAENVGNIEAEISQDSSLASDKIATQDDSIEAESISL